MDWGDGGMHTMVPEGGLLAPWLEHTTPQAAMDEPAPHPVFNAHVLVHPVAYNQLVNHLPEANMFHPNTADINAGNSSFPQSLLIRSATDSSAGIASPQQPSKPKMPKPRPKPPVDASDAEYPNPKSLSPTVSGTDMDGGTQEGKVGYFPVVLFVAAIGEGQVLDTSVKAGPDDPDRLSDSKLVERWKLLTEKIPKEQVCTVDIPHEGKIELKLRVFIANSDDSRAIDSYIRLHLDQRPAPFVVLCEHLAIAAMFNPATMDPSTDASVADRLRKQSKSRAVRFIRELLIKPESGLSVSNLRGHDGALALLTKVTEVARRQLTPITHAVVHEAIVFKAADRSMAVREQNVQGAEGGDGMQLDVTPVQQKPKKQRGNASADAQAKKTPSSPKQPRGGMSIGMLLSNDSSDDALMFSQESNKFGDGSSPVRLHHDSNGDLRDVDELMDVDSSNLPDDGSASAGKKKGEQGAKKKKEAGVPNVMSPQDKAKLAAATAALETFDREEVHVIGTGDARDVRKDGVLRKVGGLIRIECDGQLMGLKEFCVAAQNNKKRPRDAVHITSSGLSLTQGIEKVLASAEGERILARATQQANGDTGGKASGGPAGANIPAKKKKKKSEAAVLAAAIAAQALAKKMFQQARSFLSQDEGLTAYDQEKVNFTTVMAEDKNEQRNGAKAQRELGKCKNTLKTLMNQRHGLLFSKPVDLVESPDYLTKVAQPMDLGTIKNMLDQGSYGSHEEFARDMRLVWSNALSYNSPGDEMYDNAVRLSELFEDRYAAILSESCAGEEKQEKSTALPEALLHVSQRCIQDWAIFDQNGNFLPPWYGSEASFPGGICGRLIPAEGVDRPHMQVRLESPAEWHARCVDPLGNKLPEFWVRTENAWYTLGQPIDAYKDFLVEESAWIMATYRVASYLKTAPRASFDEVCKVLEGRNWRRGDKLIPHNVEILIKKADHVVSEIGNVCPKLVTHKFCTTLVQKAQRQQELLAGPKKREVRGDSASKKRRASQMSMDEEEEEVALPSDGGWQWCEDITEDENEVRQALHSIICKVERGEGASRKRPNRKDGKKGGSKDDWRCQWCDATLETSGGRSPGPDGPSTLCSACGSRYRNGHTGPPMQDEDGRFICDMCNKKFESIRGLGSHRRGCVGGQWRCDWCACTEQASGNKCMGPRGAKTLCSACGSRFRNGHTGPPVQDQDGRFVCPSCEKRFETMISLGGHRRFCDGGAWRCAWCRCSHDDSGGKSPGPDGPKTLCSPCGSRFRNGHSGPPQRDENGHFVCEDCGKTFDTISGLGGHRRFCEKLARKSSKTPMLIDDMELMEGKRREGTVTTVVVPPTPLMGSKVPRELQSETVQVWDCTSFLMGEVLAQKMPCTWESFLELLLHPAKPSNFEACAYLHMCMTELLYKELPGADPVDVFKGRPMNRYTWQELLRQYLAIEAADLRYTLCANLSEEDAKLGIAHRKEEARKVAALVQALGEKEYYDIDLQTRLEILSTLSSLALDSNYAHKHIEQSIDDVAKLANKKREEYSQRLREMEQQFALKGTIDEPSTPAALAASLEQGLASSTSSPGTHRGDAGESGHGHGRGGGGEEHKKKGRKMDMKALREAEDHERQQLDERYKLMRLESGTVRREPVGMDRYQRRVWQLGLQDFGRLGNSSEQCGLWIEPPPSGKGVAGARNAGEWIAVSKPEHLMAFINSLAERGVRESALKSKLLSLSDALSAGYVARKQAMPEATPADEELLGKALLGANFVLHPREPSPTVDAVVKLEEDEGRRTRRRVRPVVEESDEERKSAMGDGSQAGDHNKDEASAAEDSRDLRYESRATALLRFRGAESPGEAFVREQLLLREKLLSEKKDKGAKAEAADDKPAEPLQPFYGARVMVLHADGRRYGGFLTTRSDETGLWHIFFEDGEEDDLVVPHQDSIITSRSEPPKPSALVFSEPILRMKRDMLDMCAALPQQFSLWWSTRRPVWEQDVCYAENPAQLNDLILEFGRCIDRSFLENWWAPWDGFEVSPASQVSTRRCRYTEGGSSWPCKCAAIPGKSVCKRHLKKQLACAGVQGFRVLLRPSDAPQQQAADQIKVGQLFEVSYEGEWWQAKVMKVQGGQAHIMYLSDGGDTDQLEWIKVNSSRMRAPTDHWDSEQQASSAKFGGEEGDEWQNNKDGDGHDKEDDYKFGEETFPDNDPNPLTANEEVVTSAAVILRVHSLDSALRYDGVPKPEKKKPSKPKTKKR